MKNEEIVNEDDLTREDFIEKLKRDDSKMREYIESIIRSGLTIENKKLNKQMKNNSILVYKDFNLGLFKLNKNFGIKDDINLEPFRPLSGIIREEEKEEEEKKKKAENEKKEKERREKLRKERERKEKGINI